MSKLIRILIVLIMALSLPMATAIVLNGYNDHGKYKGLADTYSAFGDRQVKYVFKGVIHPTIAGNVKLAKIVLNTLKRD